MPNRIEYKKGQVINGITFIKEVPSEGSRKAQWKCFCGNVFKTEIGNIKSKNTKNCGCLRKQKLLKRNTTHGLSKTRIYNIYHNMIKRCHNKNNMAYNYYGGRGIFVCNEWKKDFMSFYNWAINNKYQEDLTIERVDNNRGYFPNNCKWATRKEQSRNTRLVKLNSKKAENIREIRKNNPNMVYSDIGKIFGVSKHVIYLVLKDKIWVG